MSIQTAVLPLARTPLYELHLELGARLVPFAGYEMPVQFPPGVINEHLNTRARAGLFDVSHMGQALFEGAGALRAFERIVPGDVSSLTPGQMRYTQLLDEEGHILDDLMITRIADEGGRERLFLVLNAANKTANFDHISAALPRFGLTRLPHLALLAMQGPQAAEILEHIVPVVSRLTFMRSAEFEYGGSSLRISRSGYTGEDGFEISLAADMAEGFARALLSDPRVLPVGLGARDSLRLEAGLCLCGHDIGEATDPVEAGLLWSISKRRRREGGFPGFSRITEAIARGPQRRRVGLILEGKAPAREGAEIETPDGRPIGRLTSGGYAPSLGRPIAIGYVAAPQAVIGEKVNVIIRGKPAPARIAAMPFVPHAYVRGA